ncbi:hypothetical protein EON65_13920 [archaeon]|nr:MAG: hypothetical protein EON65_13920 [archaeon]
MQHAIEQDNRLLMDRLAVAMSSKNIDNQLVPKPFVSYIELQRKKDMARVTQENRRLLDRIQKTQPSYNSMQWEQVGCAIHICYLSSMHTSCSLVRHVCVIIAFRSIHSLSEHCLCHRHSNPFYISLFIMHNSPYIHIPFISRMQRGVCTICAT